MVEQGRSGSGITRRRFLRTSAGAGVAGLVVGGGAGFALGSSGSSESASATPAGRATGVIKIGSAVPLTGSLAGDGEQMIRGQQLAVEEINASGGVGGRRLELVKLDTKELAPDVMKTVLQNLVSQNVAAVFMPYCSTTSVEFPIVAERKVPTFYVNAWSGNVDWVTEHRATNLFQGCPTELWYGSGIVNVVEQLVAAGTFKPKQKTAYIVSGNDPYSLNIANSFKASITKLGWRIVGFDQFTSPQANWGGVLVRIRDARPDVIVFSDYLAGDEASFIKQFAQNPTQSLVYQQYAPSVPQYQQLAGAAANGVIWSTSTGVLQHDQIAQPFIDSFTKKYGAGPGFSNGGNQYDVIKIWAQALGIVGDPYAFDKINTHVRETPYRGVCGSYTFDRAGLTCVPYPNEVKDPSIGTPTLTFQIQDGKQVVISPEPYTTGTFTSPPWLQ